MLKKLTGLFAVLTAGLFWAGSATAGVIAGSAHDFRDGGGDGSTGWATTDEICVVCHAPHNNSMLGGGSNLLWNRVAATTSNYTPYSNTASMSSAPGQPGGTSKLCLSCHDGTVAVDNFGGRTTGYRSLSDTDSQYLGSDLSNDHPISFTYPTTNASTGDPEIKIKTTAVTSANWGGSADTTIDAGFLSDGKVECQSCHDVHNTNAVASTKLLLVDNNGSKLCLTCHNK
jgi:predicted CXXCH cytochrome family protein